MRPDWVVTMKSAPTTFGLPAHTPVFNRSIAVVLAWNLIPWIAVGLTAYGYERDLPGCVDVCAFEGLALAYELVAAIVSLGLSFLLVGALAVAGRRSPRLRRVVIVGNVGAIPGILLSALYVIGQVAVLLR